MDNLNYESLIKKVEKLRLQQNEANKRYYEKNKEIIIKRKVSKYHEKKVDDNFKEKNRQNYKSYYEKNKDLIKAKNLERYYNKKNKVEFPTIEN